jgi:hypothetical protein
MRKLSLAVLIEIKNKLVRHVRPTCIAVVDTGERPQVV